MMNKKKLKYKNPYGNGKSGEKIAKLISEINLKNKKNYNKNFVSKK